MKIAHLNIRSLIPHLDELKETIDSNNIDIMCLSETWLNSNIESANIHIPGYQLYRKDRNDGMRGGGVAIFVSTKLKLKISLVELGVDCNMECIFIKILINTKTILLGTVYRPPRQNLKLFVNQLDDIFSFTFPTVDYCLLMGDVNIDLFNLNNLLTDSMNAYNMAQIIDDATRVTHSTESLLDPIFVSSREEVSHSGTSDIHYSDHKLVFCDLIVHVTKFRQKMVKIRDFKNFNLNNFLSDLLNISWHRFYYFTDIDEKVKFFTDNIINIFDYHAPLRTLRVSKPKAPWMTDVIKLMMRQRDSALRKFKNTKNQDDYARYKQLRNFVLASIRREKKNYFTFMFNQNEKMGWRPLKGIGVSSKSQIEIPPELNKPSEINNYFSSFVNNITNNCVNSIGYYSSNTFKNEINFSFKLLTVADIEQIINSIKSDVAGSDSISLRMLSYCLPSMLSQLCHIINCCLERGYFPKSWKEAKIRPIPKNTKPVAYSDLRPISLLPIFSKILEKAIHFQVYKYLTDNNILPECQSGFRRNHSTTAALLNVVDDISKAVDDRKVAALVLLDFSKAFDTVNHYLLISKLKYIGFDQTSIKFFTNYLTNRTQRVDINGEMSDISAITSGVPQGSILGPLLYLIYTFDVFAKLKTCSIQGYADDTQIYSSFYPDATNDAVEAINEDLDIINNFSLSHNLTINPKKSFFMLFGNHITELSANIFFTINNELIPYTDCTKNLGLIIDSKLKFIQHVNHLLKKSYYILKLLYANRKELSFNIRKKLCESLVFSIFNYGNIVYGPCLDAITTNKIQKVQRSCGRFVFGLRKYDSVSSKLKILRWLPMAQQWEMHLLSFTHRLLLSGTPAYLRRKLTYRSEHHSVPIRYSDLLNIPKHRTVFYQRSFSYAAVKLYNNIDSLIKKYNPLTFKAKVKKLYYSKFLIQ